MTYITCKSFFMGREQLSSEEWAKWNDAVGIPEEPTEDKGRKALAERKGVELESLSKPAHDALLKFWIGRSDEIDYGNHLQAARAIEEDLGLVPGSISDDDLRGVQDEATELELEVVGLAYTIMEKTGGREITARNTVRQKLADRCPREVIDMMLDKYFQTR